MLEISYKAIGTNIRRARKAQNLTQEKTAELLGMSVLHFGRLERGEQRISLDQLAHIADILHASFDDLIMDAVLYNRDALHKLIAASSADVSDEDLKLAEALYHVVKNYKG